MTAATRIDLLRLPLAERRHLLREALRQVKVRAARESKINAESLPVAIEALEATTGETARTVSCLANGTMPDQ